MNQRLASSLYRQNTTHLLVSKFTTATAKLARPSTTSTFRHSFSTSQVFREKLKEQVASTTTTPVKAKKTDASDVKRLFKLAKPEMKSLTGMFVDLFWTTDRD